MAANVDFINFSYRNSNSNHSIFNTVESLGIIELSVSDLPVSARIKNSLIKGGITTVEQLQQKTLKEISATKGLGKDSLTELLFFLKNANIKLKKEEKVKKEKCPLFPQAKEVVVTLMKGRPFNWKDEIGFAKRLIQVYGYDAMMRVEIPPRVTSLKWLVSGIGAWGDKHVYDNIGPTLVESEIPKEKILEEEKVELIEYKPLENKPKTLKEFLGLRK